MDLITRYPEGIAPIIKDTEIDSACDYYKVEPENLTDEMLNDYLDRIERG